MANPTDTAAAAAGAPLEVDDDLPLSALSHLVYCPRRAALVHVLGHWAENEHTVAGALVHQRIDSGEVTTTPGTRTLRSVHVRSLRMGLHGIIDALEVREPPDSPRFLVVETKRSKRRKWSSDEVQVCAQSMAIEEMTGVTIAEAVIFHAGSKRRRSVPLDDALRARTIAAARRLHEIVARREVPPPVNDKRCPECSLRGPCQPSGGAGSLVEAIRGAME